MNTYTQKLDCIQDLLNAGLSQTEIVKKMYQAWNVKEEGTLQMIRFIKSGRLEAGRATGPYFECAGNSEGIHYTNTYTYLQACAMVVQGTQPVRNFRAPMPPIVWPEMLNDGTENEAADQTPESYMHQPFTELSNDKTDRA